MCGPPVSKLLLSLEVRPHCYACLVVVEVLVCWKPLVRNYIKMSVWVGNASATVMVSWFRSRGKVGFHIQGNILHPETYLFLFIMVKKLLVTPSIFLPAFLKLALWL